jgi:stage II sporulation protein D
MVKKKDCLMITSMSRNKVQKKSISRLARTVLIFLFVFSLTSCKTCVERLVEESMHSYKIRVKLTRKFPLTISSRTPLTASDAITGRIISITRRKGQLAVDESGDRIIMDGIPRSTPVQVSGQEGRLITINGRSYMGSVTIYPRQRGADIINTVPVETYLYSVLPSEVPASFEQDALRAQSIVARTYAWYFMRKNGTSRSFDVDDTTSYQVFKGYDFKGLERKHLKAIQAAIASTEGQILTFEGEPFTAFFHANSGGILRSAADYYGPQADMACFVARVDPWSLEYPGATWNYEIDLSEFNSILGITGDLTEDSFSYDVNGFVTIIDNGKTFLTARDIRRIIGYTKVKSERFRLFFKNDRVLFDGIGYGHGVGMSQWGAQGMAVRGYSYREILEFYYPNTILSFY